MFYNAPKYGVDSKDGTNRHEISHASDDKDDIENGEDIYSTNYVGRVSQWSVFHRDIII